MPDIKQLSQSVINKIAAGEVIERPASVVKELLENSVDAGAKRIDISLEGGGLELVRVADNGCGIAPDQLTLAIAAHATSKISSADDLFSVRTLGFRGEALASISEVSQFIIRSRIAEQNAGTELEVDGGTVRGPCPSGCPLGTTIEIRNLFFNTPVRRKFLKSAQTELGHCSESFTRIALANPDVHFNLRHNDRTLYDLPPVANWRERVLAFFRGEVGDALIWVESADGDIKVSGYVADPSINRGNNRLQYLFLNGRCIRDRSLQHALGEAYRGLLMVGRFPIAFLKLEMPPASVDVNVHPTKLEVRFQDSGRLYSQLLGALRKKFLSTDLTPKAHLSGVHSSEPAMAMDSERLMQHQQQLVSWAKGQLTAPGSGLSSNPAVDRSLQFPTQQTPEFRPFSSGMRTDPRTLVGPNAGYHPMPAGTGQLGPGIPPASFSTPNHQVPAPTAPGTYTATPSRPDHLVTNFGIQLQNRYLVTENDDGIVIIDQHALHERILYEQLRVRILDGRVETQRLLVPEPVNLTPPEAAIALDSAEVLAQLGIGVEPFGGDTILVTSYPAMLANISPGEIVRQVIEQLMAGGKAPERRDLLDELLHMIACKAAVKAGDQLAPEEVTALLDQRHLFQDSHHCPHGRPTALVFSRGELDKRFGRV